MAAHSSVLAWRIPGAGEPGGLSSKGSHRVGHDWSDLAAAAQQKLEKEMSTHSSILAWKIPWMEEPGRLQSIDSQRVRHDSATSLSFFLSFFLSQQEYWSGLPFPSPVDHVLQELFTLTHPSWMALQGFVSQLTELCKPLSHDKAGIHEGNQATYQYLNIDTLNVMLRPWVIKKKYIF